MYVMIILKGKHLFAFTNAQVLSWALAGRKILGSWSEEGLWPGKATDHQHNWAKWISWPNCRAGPSMNSVEAIASDGGLVEGAHLSCSSSPHCVWRVVG